MHYLKCNKCGHLNEVKSEYLIFCSKCDKKLENNFSNWHESNSDKTLDDFKSLMCVTAEEIPQKKTRYKWAKPQSLKFWLGFVITFSIFYAVGQYGGSSLAKLFRSDYTSKDILTQKWVKETYDYYGFSFETPVKLEKDSLPLPDNIKNLIERIDSYTNKKTSGLMIAVNCSKYKPIIGKGSLEGAANGSINEIKQKSGDPNFSYTEERISHGQIPGFIQKGSYKMNGEDVEFTNVGFLMNLNMWQLIVLHRKDDEVGRQAAKRIVESIAIAYNSNPT